MVWLPSEESVNIDGAVPITRTGIDRWLLVRASIEGTESVRMSPYSVFWNFGPYFWLNSE